jgi:glycosyltransferase involved in cell wall biosynthesis
MKILHCIPTMEGGGAERQLSLLARGLVKLDVEVIVVMRRGGHNLAVMEQSGAKLVFLKSKGNYNLNAVVELYKLIKLERVDLIQTWLPQMDIVGGLAGIVSNVPFIVSERSSSLAYPLALKNTLRLLIGRFSTLVIANSRAGRDYWLDRIKAVNSTVINNIAQISGAVVNLQSYSIDATTPRRKRIIYAGRYIGYKNLDNLLLAIAAILPSYPEIVVDFYGEGALGNHLTDLARKFNIDRQVTINNYIHDLAVQLRDSAIFVSPSMFEGSPNTVIEAALCGCTLVVSDIPSHREFLDGNSAIFVSPDSVASISQGLARALDSEQDARLLGLNAQKIVSEWTESEIALKYVEAYKNVLDNSRKGAHVNL